MVDQRAHNFRNNPTDAERKLWQHIRRRQMDEFRFRRQVPIGNYIVDFICHEAKLILELDGGQHNNASHKKKDTERTAWLESEDYRVLRFWNNEVFENLDGVLQTIHRHLTSNNETPPPGEKRRPPPSRGR